MCEFVLDDILPERHPRVRFAAQDTVIPPPREPKSDITWTSHTSNSSGSYLPDPDFTSQNSHRTTTTSGSANTSTSRLQPFHRQDLSVSAAMALSSSLSSSSSSSSTTSSSTLSSSYTPEDVSKLLLTYWQQHEGRGTCCVCGKSFIITSLTRFCGLACKLAHMEQEYRDLSSVFEKLKPSMSDMQCEYCHTMLLRPKWREIGALARRLRLRPENEEFVINLPVPATEDSIPMVNAVKQDTVLESLRSGNSRVDHDHAASNKNVIRVRQSNQGDSWSVHNEAEKARRDMHVACGYNTFVQKDAPLYKIMREKEQNSAQGNDS